MKIKTKLTLNIVVVLIVVAAVVATSIFGMTFIKGKLSYLTQKSTPYQMRTVEFQREIQSAIADLVKVNNAIDAKQFQTFKGEAEKSLAAVRSAQSSLEEMSQSKLGTHEELTGISAELFKASGEKLESERAANEANAKVGQRLKESSARLKELDKRIRSLQLNRSSMFATALDDTNRFATRSRSVEEFRSFVKDLQMIFLEMQTAQKSTTVIISKGKINSINSKAQKNEYYKSNKSVAGDFRSIIEKLDEYSKLQSATLSQKTEEAREKSVSAGKEIAEKLNTLFLVADQEATLASEKFGIESNRQGGIYTQSNIANNVLISTAELISLGMSLEGLSTKLFLLEHVEEIDRSTPQINAVFSRIAEVGESLEKTLSKLGVKDELKILKGVMASLQGIRGELFAANGIVATLKKHLTTHDAALKLGDRMRELAAKQAEKGKETVSVAKGEQEKAISSVNRIVTTSISLLIGISIAAAVVGILFGIWVFRSVSRPLNQLIRVSDSVAGGNLHISDISLSDDEFGQVQGSMQKMVQNLRDMVGRITDTTSTVASSSEQLASTAVELERNSVIQTSGIETTVTAMTEMVQTIQDVSGNALNTSDSAGRMKQIALEGQRALDITSKELFSFAEIVRKSAEKTEELGSKSEAINEIVEMIKDIADQTNLLALNASIEAARAGEMGRGFAVVADSVRQLAHRTIESSDEIGRTVKGMHDEVDASVQIMKKERQAIDSIIQHIDLTIRSMGDIVSHVEQVFGMVQTIATATEEQSATAEDVNRTMVGINDITRQVKMSVSDIKGTSENFARLASDLQQMVGWFRL